MKVLLMASTGTAAHNIQGLTIHSALQLQLGQHGKSYQRLGDEKRNTLRCKFSQLKLIIIDEISMIGSDLFLQIHRGLQDIFQSNNDFAAISILAFGDLYQLPPVCQKFVFQQPSDDCARLCVHLWDNFKLVELTKIMRQRDEAEFARLLNRVRDGSQTNEDLVILETRITEPTKENDNMLHVYTTNARVDSYELSAKLYTLTVVDIIPESMKHKNLPDDQRFTGGLKSVIQPKIGARIMLTRNLDVSDGLSNWVQGKIAGFILNDQITVAVLVLFSDIKIGKEAILQSKYNLSSFPPNSVPIQRLEVSFSLLK